MSPDHKWGEAVHAAVELHDDESSDEADIIAFIKARRMFSNQ